jgi:hypothetical protein
LHIGKKNQEYWNHKLLNAVKEKNTTGISKAIKNGANLECADQDTLQKPLHIAAYSGHADVVIILIQAGADVNAQNKLGKTLLDLAHSTFNALNSLASGNLHKQQKIITLLKDKGAKCHNDYGIIPFLPPIITAVSLCILTSNHAAHACFSGLSFLGSIMYTKNKDRAALRSVSACLALIANKVEDCDYM